VNTRLTPVIAFALIAVFGSGCGLLKKKKTAETTSAVASVAPAPPPVAAPVATPAATPATTAAALIDPPAPEDFEEEAFEEITEANFESELTKIEKEEE
jgi:hypothetical protein